MVVIYGLENYPHSEFEKSLIENIISIPRTCLHRLGCYQYICQGKGQEKYSVLDIHNLI